MRHTAGMAWTVAAAALLTVWSGPVSAQAPAPFNPAKPFAGVTKAGDFVKRFRSGKPDIVAGDPFGNMTSTEFSRGASVGQNLDQLGRTPKSVKGSGGQGVSIRTPYPYKSAAEHYAAWRAAAGPAPAALPDWSGDWQGESNGVTGYYAKLSDVYLAVAPAYRKRFLTMLRGEWEGGHSWWPAGFCLPDAFSRLYVQDGNWHFMHDSKMVIVTQDRPENTTRYIYTDGRGHLPENLRFPQWYGQSQGFWDGDELVVWTNQVKGWAMTHGLPQYSDDLELIERYKRIGDEMLIDITLYDPQVFAYPWHDTATFHLFKDWTQNPSTWTDCVSTNNVYLNAKGELVEHAPGELGYRDISDPEPWFTAYKLWDENHKDLADHWKPVFDEAGAQLDARK